MGDHFVMESEQLHLTAALAEAFAALGWTADDARVREVVPTAARGHNVVLLTPPAPAYAAPALAGLMSWLASSSGTGPALVLCPSAELEPWGALVSGLARAAALRLEVARGPARAGRTLRAGALDLLVASPETASTLLRRGVLRAETLRAVVLAGPDRWPDDAVLAALMQDLPRERPRLVLASDPTRAADLAERYARKALILGGASGETTQGPVRTVTVAWERRIAALTQLLDLLDPASLAVWTADRSHHAAIAAALPLSDESIHVGTGPAPRADVVVAFDPPDPERLAQLIAAGEVVLLVPPGTEAYVERIAHPRRPLRLPGLLEIVTDEAAARRAAVSKGIDGGRGHRALLALAPLFERYDAAAVAAALYDLWVDAGAAGAAAPIPDLPATTKVFVGVGRSHGATPNDLVAVLTKEVRVAREKIGRIELRDAYALVELPAREAEQIAGALNGTMIRRKRVVARVDGAAGAGGSGARGGDRDGSRPAGTGSLRRPRSR